MQTALPRLCLAAEGGAQKTFLLTARSLESLAIIRSTAGDATDTALIERLLEEERVLENLR